MILVSLENVKKCALGVCTITQKTKINVFWKKILTPLAPSEPLYAKKFQKTLTLAFEAKQCCALSHENETKIAKITHSALVSLVKLG